MHFKSLIHCIENFFTVQDFWATCACPEKQSLPWKFSLYWIYFLSFRIFEQLAFSLKNRVALKFLTVLNHFYDSGFWATCACPENRVCPEFTVLNIYFFIIKEFWATCACPEKHELPWNVSLYWNIFIIQDFWATCICPENRVCPESFQAGRDVPPRLVRLWI